MKVKLRDFVELVKTRVDIKDADVANYISTDNMLPNRGGVEFGNSKLPATKTVNNFIKGDILISNIRPYFKKIWFADRSGTRSSDVLCFRATNEKLSKEYLYCVLQSDSFFNYVMSTSKGTKMPRGDKEAILDYEFELVSKKEQYDKYHSILLLERKIYLNNRINDNLLELANSMFKKYFNHTGTTRLSTYFLPKRVKNLLKRNVIPGDVPVVAGGLKPATYHNDSNTKSPVITISASGANAGFVQIWGKEVWSSDSSYIDSSITPNIYFWYLFLKNKQDVIFDSQSGSAQPHIYPKHIGNLIVPNIDSTKIQQFNSLVSPLFKKYFNNQEINNNLEKIKKSLLSKYFD